MKLRFFVGLTMEEVAQSLIHCNVEGDAVLRGALADAALEDERNMSAELTPVADVRFSAAS